MNPFKDSRLTCASASPSVTFGITTLTKPYAICADVANVVAFSCTTGIGSHATPSFEPNTSIVAAFETTLKPCRSNASAACISTHSPGDPEVVSFP